MEYLLGIDSIQGRLEELAHRCERECLSFMPGGAQSAASLEASKPLDQDLMDRGVRVLTLYMDSVRNDQVTLKYAQWLNERGGEVRTSPTLPIRMVMFDREVALLPVDPENTKKGAALLRGPGVITALSALFEQIWDSAKPVRDGPRPGEERGGTDAAGSRTPAAPLPGEHGRDRGPQTGYRASDRATHHVGPDEPPGGA